MLSTNQTTGRVKVQGPVASHEGKAHRGAEIYTSGDKNGGNYHFVSKNSSFIVFQYFGQWNDVSESGKSLIVFQYLAPQTEE